MVKNSLFYGAETWRLTENNRRLIEATEMDALRRYSRITRKDRIRNVSIRKRTGLQETIMKEIEQKQITCYGNVQRMAEGRLSGIALRWMQNKSEQEEDRRKTGWNE